jgi:hypothetical protein
VDFTEARADHGVTGSVGSVGDAYDNAMAESFVDTFKTELLADRVWRGRGQLELAIVEWIGWCNTRRLHGESVANARVGRLLLGDRHKCRRATLVVVSVLEQARDGRTSRRARRSPGVDSRGAFPR